MGQGSSDWSVHQNHLDDQTLGTQVAQQFIQQGGHHHARSRSGWPWRRNLLPRPMVRPSSSVWTPTGTSPPNTVIVLTSVMKEIGASVFDTVKVGSKASSPPRITLAPGAVHLSEVEMD